MENIRINKILVANRGEIAVRIIRTLKKLHIASVAVCADNDIDSLHCRLADEVVPLGNGSLKDTYLNIQKIIDAALDTGAQAIHPGYGFLSENPAFADACQANDIIFIGPSPDSIRLMGNKIAAREFAIKHSIPVLTGITGTPELILSQASTLPYPVLIKAAAGGGGKGMHIVRSSDQLADELERASREAEKYFGDGTVFVEQYIENPRHIEVQILADNHGNVVHLFERECTIQRRYQKIIEESPSPTLDEPTRARMLAAAVDICRQIGYCNAGTIEFLVDEKQNFYFLEMNTRVQVEHPVTEERTGIDIIEEQIRIADNQVLQYKQEDITAHGCAIELRVYAENPANNFLPTPGLITLYHEPQSRGVRIDSFTDCACAVSPNYDPMIAKLVCYGKTREAAIETAQSALNNFVIQGITTNIPYLKAIVSSRQFADNEISTNFCKVNNEQLISSIETEKKAIALRDVVACFLLFDLFKKHINDDTLNVWENIGYWRFSMKVVVSIDGQQIPVNIIKTGNRYIKGSVGNETFEIQFLERFDSKLKVILNGRTGYIYCSDTDSNNTSITLRGVTFECCRCDQLGEGVDYSKSDETTDNSALVSPMPGKVAKINVKEGDVVEAGCIMLVVEAMKMENNIVANAHARIKKINVVESQMVDNKMQLLVLEKD